MAKQGWITSEVTQEHMQDLVSQGYMMAVEVATCRVPEDPSSSMSLGGVHRGLSNVLRAGVRCAITLISLLFAAVLWPGAASLDPLEDLAHSVLCDHV
jgi:hypothetical protein